MIHLLGVCLFGGSLASFSYIKRRRSIQYDENNELKKNQTLIADKVHCNQKVSEIAEIQNKEEQNDSDHYLKAAGVGTGLAVLGNLLYPPLGVLSLPVLGYSTAIVFENAIDGLQEKELRISLLDSTAICIGVGLGYYALSAMASMLYLTSLRVLDQTKDKADKRITDIFNDHPPNVWLLKNGVEISVPLKEISQGDQIVINTGEVAPVDGVIRQGIASIDQQMLTGESQPEEKTVGQKIFATSLVIAGRIIVDVEKAGADTVAAHITHVLAQTDTFISNLQTRSEQLANASVAPTIALSGLALLTQGPAAMAVVLSSNYSEVMRFSVPLSMLNHLRLASRSGLLIKDGRSLEQLAKVDTVIFDKTGTLTLDQPHVGTIYPCENFSENDVLFYTATAEYRQTHPVAKAILDMAIKQGLDLPKIENSQYRIGYGICVNWEQRTIYVGSARYMRQEGIALPHDFEQTEQQAHEQGYSLIYTAINGILCGIIELRPTVRQEAAQVIRRLQQRGLNVYILSGDHKGAVKSLAKDLSVDGYIAETLPEEKSQVIEKMQQEGKKICFIGDGINDAIALKKATVSVSLQDASHIAMDSAQILLMNKNLLQLLDAFDLASGFTSNQKIFINVGTVAPSLISMGGAFFAGFTVANAVVLYCVSITMGAGLALLPLLTKPPKNQ
jgi:heavy metal translocating P-type ATPase